MFGFGRSACADEAARLGTRSYRESRDRLDDATDRLAAWLALTRSAGAEGQERAASALEAAIEKLSRGSSRTLKAVRKSGDALPDLGRDGRAPLMRLGLMEPKRTGLTAKLGLDALGNLGGFEVRKLGLALSDAPVLSGLSRKSTLASLGLAKKSRPWSDLPTPSFDLSVAEPLLERVRPKPKRRFPTSEVLLGLAVLGVAAFWFFMSRRSSQDGQRHEPTETGSRTGSVPEPPRPTNQPGYTAHLHTSSAPQPATHFDEWPTERREDATRDRPVTQPYAAGTTSGWSGGVGGATERTSEREAISGVTTGAPAPMGSSFIPSPAPAASREAGPQIVAGVSPNGADTSREDVQILRDVEAALNANPTTQAVAMNTIQVAVRGGEVTLQGTVPNPLVKQMASDVSAGVPGVTRVVNLLQIGQHV